VTGREDLCLDDQQVVDLAVGELTGRARSDALTHLLGCRTCREQVEGLTRVSEDLLLAAPEAEPPVGFESAVLEWLTPEVSSGHRRFRAATVVIGAVAAILALAVAGIVGALVTSPGSSDLAEAAMITPSGVEVGSAWHYDNESSWVFVSVPSWEIGYADPRSAPNYRLQMELDDGSTVTSAAFNLDSESGSWGTSIDVDPGQLRSVAIIDETGRIWCSATFASESAS
jgi:hypothetical protein